VNASVPRPRTSRGGAGGTFLVWLVAAVTVVGFIYVLLGKAPAPAAVSPAELAERLAPVGRVTLAAPPAAVPVPVQPLADAAAPAPARIATDSDAETKAAAQTSPKPDAGTAPSSTAPKEPPGPEAEAPAGVVTVGPEARTKSTIEAASGPGPEPGAPPTPVKDPEASLPVSPTAVGEAAPAVRDPVPMQSAQPQGVWMLPAPGAGSGRVPRPMTWERRHDLPGQPYQLRPAQ
jgi:hypothetical protein